MMVLDLVLVEVEDGVRVQEVQVTGDQEHLHDL